MIRSAMTLVRKLILDAGEQSLRPTFDPPDPKKDSDHLLTPEVNGRAVLRNAEAERQVCSPSGLCRREMIVHPVFGSD